MAVIDLVIDTTKANQGYVDITKKLDEIERKAMSVQAHLDRFQLNTARFQSQALTVGSVIDVMVDDFKQLKNAIDAVTRAADTMHRKLRTRVSVSSQQLADQQKGDYLKVKADVIAPRIKTNIRQIQRQLNLAGPVTIRANVVANQAQTMAGGNPHTASGLTPGSAAWYKAMGLTEGKAGGWYASQAPEETLKKVGKAAKETSKEIDNYAKFMNNWWIKFGVTMSGIAATIFVHQQIISWFRSFVASGAEAEKTLTRIGLAAGIAYNNLEKFQKSFRQQTGKSQFAFNEHVEAYQELIKLGMQPGDAQNSVERVLSIARGGSLELSEAAKIAHRDVFGIAEAFIEIDKQIEKTTSGSLSELGNAFRNISREFADQNEPKINKFVDNLTEWVNKNTNNIQTLIEMSFNILTGVTELLKTGAESTILKYVRDAYLRNRAGAAINEGMMSLDEYNTFAKGRLAFDNDIADRLTARLDEIERNPDLAKTGVQLENIAKEIRELRKKVEEGERIDAQNRHASTISLLLSGRTQTSTAKYKRDLERALIDQGILEMSRSFDLYESALPSAPKTKSEAEPVISMTLQERADQMTKVRDLIGYTQKELIDHMQGIVEDTLVKLRQAGVDPAAIKRMKSALQFQQNQWIIEPAMKAQKEMFDVLGYTSLGSKYWSNRRAQEHERINNMAGLSTEDRKALKYAKDRSVYWEEQAPKMKEHEAIYEKTGYLTDYHAARLIERLSQQLDDMQTQGVDDNQLSKYQMMGWLDIAGMKEAKELETRRSYFQTSGFQDVQYRFLEMEELWREKMRNIASGIESETAQAMYERAVKNFQSQLIEPELDAWQQYYAETDVISDRFYKLREQRIAAAADFLKDKLGDEVAAEEYAAKLRQQLFIDKKLTDNTADQSLWSGFRASLSTLELQAETASKSVAGIITSTLGSLDNTMGDAFFEAWNGKWHNFADAVEDACNIALRAISDLAYEMTKNAIRDIFKYLAPNATNWIMGNTNTSAAPSNDFTSYSWGNYDFSQGTAYHSGGGVGSGGTHRVVPSSVFFGAPRLHNGLRYDEYAAILQRGEEVVPANQAGRGKPIFNFQVVNNNGSAIETTQEENSSGGVDMMVVVDKMMASNAANRGSAMNKVLRQQMGAKTHLTMR